MQTVLLFYLLLLGFALVVIHLANAKFEEILPLSMMGIVVLLFFFALFGQLYAGFLCVLFLGLLSYLYLLWETFRNRGKLLEYFRELFTGLWTPGFLAFSLLFFFFFMGNYGQLSWQVDDFTHWANTVKRMTFGNDFSTNPAFAHGFASYPPGFALMQYFVQKLHGLGKSGVAYEDWINFFAYNVFWASFFLPLFRKVEWRQWGSWITGTVLIVCVPMIFYWWIFTAVYADVFLGIVLGCGFAFLILQGKEDRGLGFYSYIFGLLFFTVLVKDAGFGMAIFLALAFILSELLGKGTRKKALLLSAGALFVVLLPKVLWNWEVYSSGITKAFANKVDWKLFLDMLLGKGEDFYRDVFRNYLNAFFVRGLSIGDANWEPSLYSIFLVEILLLYCNLQFLEQKERITKLQRRIYFILPVSMTLLYFFAAVFVYLFQFSRQEAIELAGFTRYLGIPLLTLGVTIALCIFENIRLLDKRWKSSAVVVFACSLLLLSPVRERMRFVMRTQAKESMTQQAEYRAFAKQLLALPEGVRSVILFPPGQDFTATEKKDSTITKLILDYEVYPQALEYKTLDFRAKEEGMLESWQEDLLNNYEAIAVYYNSKSLTSMLVELLPPEQGLEEKTVYLVNKAEKKLIPLPNDK